MLYVLSLPTLHLVRIGRVNELFFGIINMLEDIEIHLYDYQQRPYIAEEMN